MQFAIWPTSYRRAKGEGHGTGPNQKSPGRDRVLSRHQRDRQHRQEDNVTAVHQANDNHVYNDSGEGANHG